MWLEGSALSIVKEVHEVRATSASPPQRRITPEERSLKSHVNNRGWTSFCHFTPIHNAKNTFSSALNPKRYRQGTTLQRETLNIHDCDAQLHSKQLAERSFRAAPCPIRVPLNKKPVMRQHQSKVDDTFNNSSTEFVALHQAVSYGQSDKKVDESFPVSL